jgi:outer membrane receptor protein involved in Fe transport
MQGLDVGTVVHYTGQYEDDNVSLTQNPFTGEFSKPQTPRSGFRSWRARKVREWTTLDLIASYTFNLPPPAPGQVPGLAKNGGKNMMMKDANEKEVVPLSTAEYGWSNWKWWLNNTTITLGMQNVFDSDPPFVAGAGENGYDESLATIKGRFWYAQLKKRF